MSEKNQPIWPLVLMLIWYAILLAGSGFALVLGLSFASESSRGAGVPASELLAFTIPFVLVIILSISTVLLWNSGKRNFAFALCAASLLPFVLFFFGFGLFL